jgi:SAM-dependent methyltransferase
MSSAERRWLVPDTDGSAPDRKGYWERAHGEARYSDVFSVGEDDGVRRIVVDAALAAVPCEEILLVGCGSRTDLQEELLSRAPADTRVVATDFEKVVEVARARFTHPRLSYVSLESQPRYVHRFDAVVAVNVLVNDSDLANRELLDEWAAALSASGRLVSLLPILCAGYELGTLAERDDLLRCLDLERSRWIEERQGISQIEYLPLRLRRILKESGLRLQDLRIVFLEGAQSREQTRLHYGISDHDLAVYEQLVVATRIR